MCHSNLFNDDFLGSWQDNVSITLWLSSLPEEDYQSVIEMLPTTMKVQDPSLNIVAHGTMTPKVCRLSESHGSHRDCRIRVYLRLQGTEGAGVCTRRTEYSSKHPLPTFV